MLSRQLIIDRLLCLIHPCFLRHLRYTKYKHILARLHTLIFGFKFIKPMNSIRVASTDDVADIQKIADKVWASTYTKILSKEQIDYMLELFYSSQVIAGQISNGTQTYLILEEESKPVAFASYSRWNNDSTANKLHKLYCLAEHHGKGYGRLLLKEIETRTASEQLNKLYLNVNRHNPAKTFYENMGYTIAYTEDIDIGNGFFMNDYVMSKDV